MLENWDWMEWYMELNKPEWTPGGEVIGIIWSILYPLIIISYGWVIYRIYLKKIPKKYLWSFIVNIAANLLFSPIFFGLKNIPLASLDILIVLLTIIINLKVTYKYSKLAALLQLPYLVWVSIASFLQISILLLN